VRQQHAIVDEDAFAVGPTVPQAFEQRLRPLRRSPRTWRVVDVTMKQHAANAAHG
jgi:hypothetical protein